MKLCLIFTENEWGLLSIGGGAPCGKKEALCDCSLQGAKPPSLLKFSIDVQSTIKKLLMKTLFNISKSKKIHEHIF